MNKFFKSWQRKAGVATTVMALFLTGAWMKSLTHEDEFDVTANQQRHCFDSASGKFHWLAWNDPSATGQFNWLSTPVQLPNNTDDHEHLGLSNNLLIAERRFVAAVLDSREYRSEGGSVTLDDNDSVSSSLQRGSVPYWSIVIPLTVLSTQLLLVKPRASRAGG